MPKGYWVVRVSVENLGLFKEYAVQVQPHLDQYGGRFLARGGKSEIREGQGRPRNVIVEFDSYEDARAAYEAPEYQELAVLRQRAADADFVIVEGLD